MVKHCTFTEQTSRLLIRNYCNKVLLAAVGKEGDTLKRRRTRKERQLDESNHYDELEEEKATKEAKEAFKHKPYQSIHTSGGRKT